MKEYTISVDFGGTNILTAAVDKKLNVLNRVKIETKQTRGAEKIVKDIADTIEEIIKITGIKESEVRAICMGVPGTVNPEGIIASAPNLGIRNFNIKEELQKYIKIPVFIENDVNLAALGIKKFEFKDKVNNMLVVFIGTGIGSGIIIDGKLYRGSSFYAGEIGHILVDFKGNFSGVKTKSTFENIASRTAIVNAITSDIKDGKKSVLSSIVKHNKKIKSKSLLQAIKKKDKIALKHVDKAATIIGTVLGSITTLMNFDTIVLGGGVIEAMSKFMMPEIEESFREAVLKEPGKDVKLLTTELGDDAAIYGGVALADEFLINK